MAVKALIVIATGKVVPSNPPVIPLLSVIVDLSFELQSKLRKEQSTRLERV